MTIFAASYSSALVYDIHISESVFVSFVENLQIFMKEGLRIFFFARALIMLYVPFWGQILHINPSVEYYQ